MPAATVIGNSGPLAKVKAGSTGVGTYEYSTSFEGMTLNASPTYETPTTGGTWWWAQNMSPKVSDVRAYTGTQSLQFAYPAQPIPGEVVRQQNFWTSQSVTEFWFSFRWYVPSNYVHRNVEGAGPTAKLFQIWKGAYQDPSIRWGVSLNRVSDSQSSFIPAATRGNEPDPTQAPVQNYPSAFSKEQFIGPNCIIVPGGWYRLRFYFKPASNRNATDGVWKCWVNDTVYMNGGGQLWTPTNAIGTAYENDPSANNGYLMGSHNAGYAEATTFYIDDVFLTTSNPGW